MGESMARTLIKATGLPEDAVTNELEILVSAHGKKLDSLTLEELREITAEYLQTVFLELKEDLNAS